MGVRTQLSIETVKEIFKNEEFEIASLMATSNGITDTTYIAKCYDGNELIIKLYEQALKIEIEAECNLLNMLQKLPVPKQMSNIYEYKGKYIVAYSKLRGKSLDVIDENLIIQISNFLGSFHKTTKGKKTINENQYSLLELEKLYNNILNYDFNNEEDKKIFIKCFKKIQSNRCSIDGIIHGDLFKDNALFEHNKLTGVFDFIQACNGSFLFDIAVVINNWCYTTSYDIKLINVFISSYNKAYGENINLQELKGMMKFACLFYACQRFNTKYIEKRNVPVKDYREFLLRFDEVDSLEINV